MGRQSRLSVQHLAKARRQFAVVDAKPAVQQLVLEACLCALRPKRVAPLVWPSHAQFTHLVPVLCRKVPAHVSGHVSCRLFTASRAHCFAFCQVFGEQCGQHSCLTSPPWPFDSCIRRLAEMGCLTCTVSRSRMHATRSRSTFNAAIRRRKEGPGCNQTMTTCRLGGHLELGLRLCRALAVLHQRPEACVELRSRPGAECHAARPAASVRC